MKKVAYSMLMRTFNSERILPVTLNLLEKQTISPIEHIFVDSGSTDRTLSILPGGSKIHRYVGSEFNYSNALNQGLEYISTDYVLIISSHTSLCRFDAVEFALTLLTSDERIGAAYFDPEASGELRYELINRSNFDGFNGLWNAVPL